MYLLRYESVKYSRWSSVTLGEVPRRRHRHHRQSRLLPEGLARSPRSPDGDARPDGAREQTSTTFVTVAYEPNKKGAPARKQVRQF